MTTATLDDVKALRLASPISAFTFWHFELVAIADRLGVPTPLFPELEKLHRAGLTAAQAVAKIAKRYW